MHRISTLALACALVVGATASAQDVQPGPYGTVYDPTYTLLALRNYRGTANGSPFDEGWALQATARMVGDGIPNESALVYVMRQGGNEIGRTRCELRREDYNAEVEWRGFSNCHNREQRLSATGDVDIDVVFVDGTNDAETLVWRHRVQVLTATRVRGSANEPDAAEHYLNQNGEVLRAVIHRVPNRMTPYALGGRAGNSNGVEIVFHVAPSKWNRHLENAPSLTSDLRLRCTVDGQPLEIESNQVRSGDDEIESTSHNWGRSREEQEHVSYRRVRLVLPIEWGQPRLGRMPVLEEHPGRWECVIRQEGEVVRGFAFTVLPDGTFAPHPEEQHLPIPYNAHLVDVTIPNTQRWETRVDPASVRTYGIAYGHVLQSAEARARIDALPTLGNATLPQPQPPRGNARGGRGGRGRRGR